MILLAACFAVLWGTLFPVISEAITNDKISLDADWYNRLMVPIGLFLLLPTAIIVFGSFVDPKGGASFVRLMPP